MDVKEGGSKIKFLNKKKFSNIRLKLMLTALHTCKLLTRSIYLVLFISTICLF